MAGPPEKASMIVLAVQEILAGTVEKEILTGPTSEEANMTVKSS